jgi:PAS domain S-box-containing protein
VSLDPELAASAVVSASDAIVTVDEAGQVTSWNRAAEGLLGFSREDAISGGLTLIIPAEHRARHVAAFHATMSAIWRTMGQWPGSRPRLRPVSGLC